MHVVRPSVVLILVLPRRSSQSTDSSRILTYPLFVIDSLSWSENYFMPISAWTSRSGSSRRSSKASGLEGASHCIRPCYPCWTIHVERISSVKWIDVQPVALRLVVFAFAPFQILHFKRIFGLLIIKLPFCVSNEICDDGRQEKCGLISMLVIALFWTSGFTVILNGEFRPFRKPHLLRRYTDSNWFVFHLLIDRHDFSYLLHQNCRVTSLRIIEFPCISRIGIDMLSSLLPLVCILSSHPLTLVTFKTRISYEATATMPTLYSRLWPWPPPFTFKFCQRVKPPPGR